MIGKYSTGNRGSRYLYIQTVDINRLIDQQLVISTIDLC